MALQCFFLRRMQLTKSCFIFICFSELCLLTHPFLFYPIDVEDWLRTKDFQIIFYSKLKKKQKATCIMECTFITLKIKACKSLLCTLLYYRSSSVFASEEYFSCTVGTGRMLVPSQSFQVSSISR